MSIKVGAEGRIEPKEAKQRTRKRVDRPADVASSAKQSERAERRKPKKRKTMKRCTSPSHFAVDPEEEIKYGEDYTLDLPSRERIDTLLRGVSAFYYRTKEAHPNQTSVWVDNEYDQTQYSSLDLLLSPVRRVTARESWSNKEIAIFESAMCAHPKEFQRIARLIKTKNTQECVNFYYTFWKHHAHYRIWKNRNRPSDDGAASAPPVPSSRVAAAPRSSPVGGRKSAAAASPPPRLGSINPASAAFSAVPTSLLAARDDATHPRIRIVDPKTGQESYFILPMPIGDEEDPEPDEEEPEEEEEEEDAEESASESASAAPPSTTAAASPKSVTGYRCCLPSNSNPGALCHKFFKTTNALGSHLRMAHKIQKAVSSGRNDNIYVECVQ